MTLFQNTVRELCDLLFSFILGLEATRRKYETGYPFHEFTIAVILHIIEEYQPVHSLQITFLVAF